MPVIALYDGQCLVCKGTKRALLALDWRKRVQFVDLHDRSRAALVAPGLEQTAALGQIHAIDERGQIDAGFRAVRRLLRELPLGFPLWLLLHIPGMSLLGEQAYRFIARRRYILNRWLGARVCRDGICRD